jgi:predicted esterase
LAERLGRDNGDMGESVVGRECIAYCSDQLLDLYEPGLPRATAAVVLWHGSGANERDVLEPLARQIARSGVRVVVPDWSADDDADGRDHLRGSLSFVRNLLAKGGEVDRVVLVGWSLGASAGLDVVRHPELLGGWRPTAFVGLAGGFNGSPFSEEQRSVPSVDSSISLVLVHGSSDEVVPPERSRATFDQLRREGWNVTLDEVATDHAGAIGTVYDPVRQRCVPTDDRGRREVLEAVATLIVDLALTG